MQPEMDFCVIQIESVIAFNAQVAEQDVPLDVNPVVRSAQVSRRSLPPGGRRHHNFRALLLCAYLYFGKAFANWIRLMLEITSNDITSFDQNDNWEWQKQLSGIYYRFKNVNRKASARFLTVRHMVVELNKRKISRWN